MTALHRGNPEYAITIFNQVLAREPALYECREALLAAQTKKAGAVGGFFKKMIGTASSSPQLAKAQMALRKNPLEAIQIAEQILNTDPYNAMANKILAEAALEADFPKTAVLSLEIVYKNSSKDREAALKLAEALGRSGQAQRGESILNELLRLNPADQEVSQAMKGLSARRTLNEGGYESLADGQGSYRDILRNKEEAVTLEQEKREVKSEDVAGRLIADYEAKIAKEPGNLKMLRSTAELYAQKKDFDRALEYYNKIVQTEGAADASLEKLISETTLKKLDHALAQLDPQAPDHAEQLARLNGERQAFLVSDCQRRVERYPNDLEVRFELGKLYFQAGKLSEAIQELQKAQANPHRRGQALSLLGQAFARRNMNDIAARTFQNAIKERVGFDEEKKELTYMLGCVLEKMGKKEEAIELFKQIYEVDIGYKDVSAKVDAYYAGS